MTIHLEESTNSREGEEHSRGSMEREGQGEQLPRRRSGDPRRNSGSKQPRSFLAMAGWSKRDVEIIRGGRK
jgi:hypothetical protein